MTDLETIQETAGKIILQNPGPVVRMRLLRDVLHLPFESEEVQQAREELEKSRWVQLIEKEQWPDGSWGRLHSQDSCTMQKIPTTEYGVERALALGLDADHPVLQNTLRYLVELLTGKIECRDRAEVNDRWATGVQLFTGSTLSRIKADDAILDDVWQLWVDIARRTFESGTYNPEAEIYAHHELTGASVKNSYLVISNRYALNLLSSRPVALPCDLEADLLKWLWHKEDGIGYLEESIFRQPTRQKPGRLERWFSSLELLSCFPSWGNLAGETIQWLWEERTSEGLWDFGQRVSSCVVLPSSDSWRSKTTRKLDWSTRILVLLTRYYSNK